MNTQTAQLITKLLLHVENYDSDRKNSEFVIKEYSELINDLKIENNLHQNLNKNIHLNLVKDLILNNENNPDINTNKKRIKYISQIDQSELENILNFSFWKNTPNTNNLFKSYEIKKNILINKNNNLGNSYMNNNSFKNNNNKFNQSEEIDEDSSNNFNKKKNNSSNNYNNNNTYNNFKKNNRIEEEDEEESKFIQSNNYMCNSNNLKRKNTQVEYGDYTNSIYNVNKKKKTNNSFNIYNKNNNKYKKNNIEEEDEEEHNKDAGGSDFTSAISMVNKHVFKHNNNIGAAYKERERYIENNYNSNYNNNNNNNSSNNENLENKSNFKKFNPPYKTGSNSYNNNTSSNKIFNSKKEEEKEKELDDKLKGFDKKLIEFIESEILSFSPNVKWEDIAGLEFAKKTIKEIIIWPLLRPDIFNGIRRPPKGLLLFGPPGTGKTMIAKAIASESKSKFFNISASSLMSKWIGESEKLVRTLFALASYYQPSVVFIDEIDSILTARSENECEASRRLKTEFLVQLDGAGTNQDDRILIIGATNRPQEIDDAFIRRLAKRLYIPLPNVESRKQLILHVINKEKEKEKSKYDLTDEDVTSIVCKSKGYSGSDMIGVCREAAMMPIRNIEDIFNVQLDNLRGINLDDFIQALNAVKPSVSEKSIAQYVKWNIDFGSFQFDEKDNDN